MTDVDNDRAQVYAAEAAAFEGTTIEVLTSFADLQQASLRVLSADWWPVGVTWLERARVDARSSTTRWDEGRVPRIRIARGQQTLGTLSHELAHLLAGSGAGHGTVFRRAHVDVVLVLIGGDAAQWLAAAYRSFGLALGPRRWPEPTRGIAL